MKDILVFTINAITNVAYILTEYPAFIAIFIGFAGIVFLRIKEQVDSSVREEQNIL